jgi:FixJ family two-component response regulator
LTSRDSETLQRRSELATLRCRYETLTSREREVMSLVIRGFLNKQAASELARKVNSAGFGHLLLLDDFKQN